MAIGLSGRDKISLQDLFCYMVSQICGGLVGALTYFTVFGDAFLLKPLFNYSVADTVVVEMLYSMALCYVVLNVATTENTKQGNVPNDFFGLAIGLTVTAAAITIGPISGCSLNPAVSIGSFVAAAMANHSLSTGMCFVYNATPFLGAALAALFFYFVQGGLTDRFEYEAGFHSSPRLTPRTVPKRVRRATYTTGHYLRKGSVFEISKEQENHVLQIGVKWEVPDDSQADIDVTCTKFNKEGQLHEAVYFAYPEGDLSQRGKKNRRESLIVHNGDNVTGSGHGLVGGFISSMKKKDDTDDERIVIKHLAKLKLHEPSAQYMFFTLNVFSSGDSFAKLKNLRIRIVDAGTYGNEHTEICLPTLFI
jgi:stress response protein SCP2